MVPMCAIAGVVDLPVSTDTAQHMMQTMARRGPDGNGIYTTPICTLLHARLAIVDPEGGSQPMTYEDEQERYILIYNGELYNTQEIRRELERFGHRFRGHSDTEVVLHAYIQWGESCVDRFNGIFAMAVWEERRRRLFLARDRIGVKPLFFKRQGGGLLFASEIKTILAYPTVRPELDEQGAAQILLLGPGRIPGSGVFRGFEELEPGQLACYEAGKLTVRSYWKMRDREHRDDLPTTVEKVRALVIDAIKRQMIADVPVGCFLSGGLDSSIISAVCAAEYPGIDTFSVDYQDNDQYFAPGKFQPNADAQYIDLMTRTIGSNHHWTVLDQQTLLSELENATLARDLPGMADVDFSLLAFCGHIRKNVKVALSGECADEIFGGYPWYRDPAVRELDGFPWAQNTRCRMELMHPSLKIDGEDFVRSHYQMTLDQSDILPESPPLERRMKQMVNLNFRWFMQTLLDRKDRMSMYHGLEVRVPFCDYRIAEYLYSIPWAYKDLDGVEKGLLRKAVDGLLPEPIRYRKKSPYPKTHHPEYGRLVRQRLDGLLQRKDAPIFMLMNRDAMVRFLDDTPRWPWYGQLMGMPQTMAYFLQINFWLEENKIELNW